MFRYVFCILFFSASCILGTAQSVVDKTEFKKYLSLRTNPFSFLEIDGGIMLGVNYRWHPRWSFTVDPTFVFFTLHGNQNGNLGDRPLGIRIKTDLRYHIKKFILGIKGVFISPEAHVGFVRTSRSTTFGINCINGNCDYYMTDDYKEIKNEQGMAVKLGLEFPYRRRNGKLKIELFLGVGLTYFNFSEKDIPIGGSFLRSPVYQDNLGFVREGIANLAIPAGLKISFHKR